MMTNRDRAAWAHTGIEAFTSVCHMDGESNQTKVKDLATDLVHYLRLECCLDFAQAENVMLSAISMAHEEMLEDPDD